MGAMSSKGLELLAEDGKPDLLASEWKTVSTDVAANHTHLMPGDTVVLRVAANDGDVLSAATMLIQTNDGFTGLDSAPLTPGDTEPNVYDAGTEDNTEIMADIPGFYGPFHGPDSKPHRPISMHEGITGRAEVSADFNWPGPVARFSIREVAPMAVAPGTYEVTVTNVTASKQALSPVVIATHPASVHAWQMGGMAAEGLELVAEDGKPDLFAADLEKVSTDVVADATHLMPGDYLTLRITAKDGDVLSAATMLIQTNDGFTGLDSVALNSGDHEPNVYDAGTEDNTEIKSHIPGFYGAFKGPDSNPHTPIAMHGGIRGNVQVPSDFDWDSPVARFSIRAVDSSEVLLGSGTGAGAGTGTGTGTGVMPGGMPTTGSGDATLSWLIAILAATLALSGLTLRRTTATQR